jgi:hypothetical protein
LEPALGSLTPQRQLIRFASGPLWLPTLESRTLSEMILRRFRVLVEIGDTMRILCCLLLLWSVLISGCGESKKFDEQPKVENESKEDAVAAIKKLGGKVQTAENHGQPVVKVDLFRQPVTDAGLVHLKGLKSLSNLRLSETKVTDTGLVHIKGLTKLSRLFLSDIQVTDAGLVYLKRLVHMEMLDLSKTDVTDAGLIHLKGMTSLTHLYLSDTKVTDAGLVHLKGIWSLRSLSFIGTKVTDSGVKDIQSALPKCRIGWTKEGVLTISN